MPWRRATSVHLSAVSERSSGVDERLAAIFRDMRVGLRMSPAQLARSLKTTPEIVSVFEAGHVRAFPAWPETVRIVSELGTLHRIDTRPILARIRDQVGPAGLGQVPRTPEAARRPPSEARTASPPAAQSDHPLLRAMARRRTETTQDPATSGNMMRRARRAVRRTARTMFALSAPVVMVGGLIWMAQTQPTLLLRAANALPDPISGVARALADYLVVQMAPRREGLRWIEVSDPRARKSDKLRQASR